MRMPLQGYLSLRDAEHRDVLAERSGPSGSGTLNGAGFEDPAEIAAVIAFVCSARASATTGAALRADGGVVRAIG
jgi:NAD(P)-dependent dehydrogenase (short-subunit alcohol dehydrogenase family)